jgi:hypothetical protein
MYIKDFNYFLLILPVTEHSRERRKKRGIDTVSMRAHRYRCKKRMQAKLW